MDNKRMLQHCIVACVVVLAVCVTPMGGGQLAPGTSQVCPAEANSCQIDVRIDCNALAACTGVVDPKVLLVNKGNGTPKVIHWKLTGSDNGYEFKDQKVITGEQAFDCDQPGPHKKEVTCKDLFQGTKTTFEYQIHVVKSSDGSEISVDPWIVNS